MRHEDLEKNLLAETGKSSDPASSQSKKSIPVSRALPKGGKKTNDRSSLPSDAPLNANPSSREVAKLRERYDTPRSRFSPDPRDVPLPSVIRNRTSSEASSESPHHTRTTSEGDVQPVANPPSPAMAEEKGSGTLSHEEIIIQALGNAYMAGLRAAIDNSALLGLEKSSTAGDIDLSQVLLHLTNQRPGGVPQPTAAVAAQQPTQTVDRKTETSPPHTAASTQSTKEQAPAKHVPLKRRVSGRSSAKQQQQQLEEESPVPSFEPATSRSPEGEPNPLDNLLPHVPRRDDKSPTGSRTEAAAAANTHEPVRPKKSTAVTRGAVPASASWAPSTNVHVDDAPVREVSTRATRKEAARQTPEIRGKSSSEFPADPQLPKGPIQPTLISVPPPSMGAAKRAVSVAAAMSHHGRTQVDAVRGGMPSRDTKAPAPRRSSMSPRGGQRDREEDQVSVSLNNKHKATDRDRTMAMFGLDSTKAKAKMNPSQWTIDRIPPYEEFGQLFDKVTVSSLEEFRFLVALMFFSFLISEARTERGANELNVHQSARALILDDKFFNSAKSMFGASKDKVEEIFDLNTLYDGKRPITSSSYTHSFNNRQLSNFFKRQLTQKIIESPAAAVLGSSRRGVVETLYKMVVDASVLTPAMVFFPNEFFRLITTSASPFLDKYLG